MNHQTLCELNGYLFCLLLPWCTASTICDIAHTSHLSLQIPPPEKKQQLWALLSLLCATWWCSLKSMNEDISGAVYAEQSHLGLTLPPSLRPQHPPPPPPLFPPPPLPGWLVFWGFFLPYIRVRHRSSPAHHIHRLLLLLLQLCRLFPAAATHNNLQ